MTNDLPEAVDAVVVVQTMGAHAIVQDEVTSVVFRMPRSAIATGAVSYVVPLNAIGSLLQKLAGTEPVSR